MQGMHAVRPRAPCCAHAGDAFLAVTGSAQIKVYDRDCIERGESLQGDMYIRDQRNTKGHISPCTTGQWHPTDRCGAAWGCHPTPCMQAACMLFRTLRCVAGCWLPVCAWQCMAGIPVFLGPTREILVCPAG